MEVDPLNGPACIRLVMGPQLVGRFYRFTDHTGLSTGSSLVSADDPGLWPGGYITFNSCFSAYWGEWIRGLPSFHGRCFSHPRE